MSPSRTSSMDWVWISWCDFCVFSSFGSWGFRLALMGLFALIRRFMVRKRLSGSILNFFSWFRNRSRRYFESFSDFCNFEAYSLSVLIYNCSSLVALVSFTKTSLTCYELSDGYYGFDCNFLISYICFWICSLSDWIFWFSCSYWSCFSLISFFSLVISSSIIDNFYSLPPCSYSKVSILLYLSDTI